MVGDKKYFRRKGKRGVLYLQERHQGVPLWDCLKTTDERIAEIRRREIHIAVERGDYQNFKTLFKDAVKKKEKVLYGGKAEATRKIYAGMLLRHIVPWFGEAPVSEIQPKDLLEYKEHREDMGAGEVGVRQEIWLVSWLLGEFGRVVKLPKRTKYRYPHKPVDKFATHNEVLSIAEGMASLFYRSMALSSAYSGLRKVDVFALRWSMFDFESGFLRRTQQKTGKTIRHPLHPLFIDALSLVPRGIGDTLVYPGAKQTTLRDHWHRARKKVQLDWVRIHDLRHFYASYLASQGVDIGRIKELLGLKTMKMVERYAKYSDQSLQDAVGVFVAKPLPETKSVSEK